MACFTCILVSSSSICHSVTNNIFTLAVRCFSIASFCTIIFVFPNRIFADSPSSPEVNRVEEIREAHNSHSCSSRFGSLHPKPSSVSSCLGHHSCLLQCFPRKIRTIPDNTRILPFWGMGNIYKCI